eukprot:TRINITY_DN3022_c2_g1_i1.p1 TRINITY_DN3022_c2_g1~~TRINITY_DN3022_c2_g1_i1.p1  ORF type:complete len:527 (-),score=253.97 TRINITY_DN3022_c2_g1_i1:76-1656(-)
MFTVVHYNDAYHVEKGGQEPVGGASRFKTACNQFANENPIITCGGDVFNPSLLSTITKGKHMVPILNALGTHYGVLGNHDFDFGLETLMKYNSSLNFPWIMSNCFDATEPGKPRGPPLVGSLEYALTERNGIKIGIIGLVEEDWILTLCIDKSLVNCEDFVATGQKLAKYLKEEKGVEFVIALTHMRVANDEKLANEVPQIDLILGGHDHFLSCTQVNGTWILKGGCDFKWLCAARITRIEPKPENKKSFDVTIQTIDIVASIPEDPEVNKIVESYEIIMKERVAKIIAIARESFDTRSTTVRLRESNIGNFAADVMRLEMQADIALLNGGTIRSDEVYAPGPFALKDLLQIFPFEDIIILIEATGQQILESLENGVSQYPKTEGRFLQVSGIRFAFDPSKQAGNRILEVQVEEERGRFVPLNLTKIYKVATKTYLTQGKDGFTSFCQSKKLVDDENGQLLSLMIRHHLLKKRVVSMLDQEQENKNQQLATAAVNVFKKRTKTFQSPASAPIINAQLEGRITMLTN